MLQCYYTFVFVYCCNFNQLLYCNSMLVTTCNVCIVQPYRPSIPYTRVCDGFLFVVFENPTFNFNNPRNKKIGTRSNLKLSCLSIVPRGGGSIISIGTVVVFVDIQNHGGDRYIRRIKSRLASSLTSDYL